MNMEDLTQAYYALEEARPGYERADSFYRNTVDEFMASPKVKALLVKAKLSKLDGFNFARIPVDAVANKLYMNALTSGEQSADALIENIWDMNEMGVEAPALHRNVCIFGDAYVRVWPAFDDAGVLSGVDLMNEDPRTVRVFYDPANPRKKTFALKSWCEGEGASQLTFAYLYYADRLERWVHKGPVSRQKSAQNKWEPFTADGEESVLENSLGVIPFYHFRNDRPYGTPIHLDAYGPQLAINKLIRIHLGVADYQSFPQRFALADPEAELTNFQQGSVDPFHPEDDDDDPENVRGASTYQSGPDTVHEFQGMREVGQFAAADSVQFMDPLDRYIKMLSVICSTPMHEFDSTGDAISGASRKKTNESFFAKVDAMEMSLGITWGQLMVDVLDYMGVFVERVDVVWRPLEPAETQEDWQILNLKKELGIPLEVLFVEAGYSEEQAEEWAAKAEAKAAEMATALQENQDAKAKPAEESDAKDKKTTE